MARLAIIGTGYVGLTSGACFAHLGHDVVCADVDEGKVERLTRGEMPFLEAGLEALVREGLDAGNLRFTTDIDAAVADREFVYLCVPTPQSEDGSADRTYLEQAAARIGPHLEPGAVVINKSTVPVGSTLFVSRAIGRDDVHVVSNPEFLREGSAVSDSLNPDRVVIGADDAEAARRVRELSGDRAGEVVITDPASAELIKYAANAFLATRLSFVNEVATIAELVGADMDDVVAGLRSDPRIGRAYLSPGPGWGGSCLPKDTRALLHIADAAGYDFRLLHGVIDANSAQFGRIADKAVGLLGGDVAGRTVAAWGLTFKGGTDDLRCSPALEVLGRLVDRGAQVTAFDPAMPEGADVGDGIKVVADAYAAVQGAELLMVMTDWPEFATADLPRVAELMSAPRVVDARNLLDRDAARAAGFEYRGVGRS